MFSDILQRSLNFGAFFFLYIVLKWQLVNTPSFVMLACVEVFKTSVLQLAPRYVVPRTPLQLCFRQFGNPFLNDYFHWFVDYRLS